MRKQKKDSEKLSSSQSTSVAASDNLHDLSCLMNEMFVKNQQFTNSIMSMDEVVAYRKRKQNQRSLPEMISAVILKPDLPTKFSYLPGYLKKTIFNPEILHLIKDKTSEFFEFWLKPIHDLDFNLTTGDLKIDLILQLLQLVQDRFLGSSETKAFGSVINYHELKVYDHNFVVICQIKGNGYKCAQAPVITVTKEDVQAFISYYLSTPRRFTNVVVDPISSTVAVLDKEKSNFRSFGVGFKVYGLYVLE